MKKTLRFFKSPIFLGFSAVALLFFSNTGRVFSASAKTQPGPLPEIKTVWTFPNENPNPAGNEKKTERKEGFVFAFSPVIDETGENIFLVSSDMVFKLRSADRTEIKNIKLNSSVTVQPIYDSLKLFICDSNNTVICLDSDLNDKPLWRTQIGNAQSIALLPTPKGIVTVCKDGTIYLLGKDAGDIVWQCNIGEELFFPPNLDEQDELLYILSVKGGLFSVKLKNGTFIKKTTFQKKVTSPPVFYDRLLYLAVEGGIFTAFNPEKNKNKWELTLINDIAAPAVVYDDSICFATLSNQVLCCDKDSGSLEGRFAGKRRFYLPPAVCGDLLFAFGHHDGILAANLEKGKTIGWIEHSGSPTTSPIVLAQRKMILIIFDNKQLRALDYSEVEKSQLIDK